MTKLEIVGEIHKLQIQCAHLTRDQDAFERWAKAAAAEADRINSQIEELQKLLKPSKKPRRGKKS